MSSTANHLMKDFDPFDVAGEGGVAIIGFLGN
jgi:hypothetical protein